MGNWWDFRLPEGAGEKGRELSGITLRPDDKGAIEAELICCRLESAIDNIWENDLDIAIVSDDALAEWEAARKQVLSNKKTIVRQHVGDAGSQLMIGISHAFLDERLGTAWRDVPEIAKDPRFNTVWEDAVTFSYENELPIWTTFKEDLEEFLNDECMPVPPIKVRNGTIEAQARLYRRELCPTGAPVIADLVVTGNSMRDNFFEPVKSMKASSATIIANMPPKGHPKRPAMSRLIMPITHPKSIMTQNRLLLAETAIA